MSWDIAGKRVLITGGTTGIGRATAEELARRGAQVTFTSRSLDDAIVAEAEIERDVGVGIEPEALDLVSLASVRTFVEGFKANHDRLDVLINNAGTMTGRRQTTAEGFERTLAVNHLGPFLLTTLLTDLLVASAPARIINVSSETHRSTKSGLDFDDLQMTSGYSPSKAYSASKLANILFTAELDRRLGDQGVTARALHPGVVATSFGKGKESPRWMGWAMTVLKPFLRTPAKGAETSVLLATCQPADLDAGLYWSSREPMQPSAPALDAEAARQLWDVSEELVGLAS